jgi:ABC-2 type transport system ATP-binding protein
MRTLQLEIGGTPAVVLKSLRGVPGVQAANVLSADGSAHAASVSLPAGVHSFQVTSTPGTDVRASLASAVIAAGYQLFELRTVRPTLEEVFINVISQEQPEDDYLDDEGDDSEFVDADDDYGEADDGEEEVAAAPVRERVTTRRRGRR